MECLLPYLCMVTVPHEMVGLERMLDYRGVGLARFHCTSMRIGINITIMTFTYIICNNDILTKFSNNACTVKPH